VRAPAGPAARAAAAALVLLVGSVVVLAAARHRSAVPAAHRAATAAERSLSRPAGGPTGPGRTAGIGAGAGAGIGAGASVAPAAAAAQPDPAALAAADAFVAAYAGYDWRRPDGDPAAWRGLVTPQLYAALTGPSASAPGMTPAQVAARDTAVPSITSTTWEGGGAGRATVLVDCVLTVTGAGSPPGRQDNPYPLGLVAAGGRWLVASVGDAGPPG